MKGHLNAYRKQSTRCSPMKLHLLESSKKRQKEFADRWMILQEAPDMYILSCFSDPREIEEQDCFLETLGAEFYATEIKCKRFIVEDNKPMFIQKAPEDAIKIKRFKFPISNGHIRKYAKFRYKFNKFVKLLCSENQLTFVLKNHRKRWKRC